MPNQIEALLREIATCGESGEAVELVAYTEALLGEVGVTVDAEVIGDQNGDHRNSVGWRYNSGRYRIVHTHSTLKRDACTESDLQSWQLRRPIRPELVTRKIRPWRQADLADRERVIHALPELLTKLVAAHRAQLAKNKSAIAELAIATAAALKEFATESGT